MHKETKKSISNRFMLQEFAMCEIERKTSQENSSWPFAFKFTFYALLLKKKMF